jgi:hypothetical protein
MPVPPAKSGDRSAGCALSDLRQQQLRQNGRIANKLLKNLNSGH